MTRLQFVTLNVFTSQPYTGNPLAVVFLPEKDKRGLSQNQKQLIAREFNFSETIFVHPATTNEEKDGGKKRRIDIFTTQIELPFAGHPTIGAASWFLCLSSEKENEEIVSTLTTKSGDIPIRRVYSSLRETELPSGKEQGENAVVTARIAHNVRIHAARFPLKELLRMHSSLVPFFPSGEQERETISFPIVSVVNGMTQVHVELPSLAALEAVTISADSPIDAAECGYLDQGWRSGLVVAYFFVRDVEDLPTGKRVIRTRSILGRLEDPATGSAASGLAAYLTLVKGNPGQYLYDFVQGVEMGRRSEIGVVVVVGVEGKIESVELKGAAVKVSGGSILVPE